MMSSGPNSYYDDYARKKGSSRLIHDPPSLLTDRGAYVNFLEVQLERVSAACLGVQAHDQRINDLQEQIISLDEKLGTSTRLVGLAQQCTEEVRLESEAKLSQVNKRAMQEHNEMIMSLQAITDRINDIEKSFHSSFSSVLPRILQLEQKLSEVQQERELEKELHNKETSHLKLQIFTLESNSIESARKIDSFLLHIDKLENAVFESDRKIGTSMQLLEKETNESMSRMNEEIQMNINDSKKQLNDRVSKLEDIMTKINQATKDYVDEQIQSAKTEQMKVNSQNIDKKLNSLEEQVYNSDKRYHQELQDVNETLKQQIQEKHKILENIFLIQEGLKGQNERLEDESRNQFQAIEHEIESIHDIMNSNNTAIINKIGEKIDYDEQHYDLYNDQLSQLKDTVNHLKEDFSTIDNSRSNIHDTPSSQLQSLVREQIVQVLQNEMALAKSLAGLITTNPRSNTASKNTSDKEDKDSRKKSRDLSPIRPVAQSKQANKDKKSQKEESTFDFSLSDGDEDKLLIDDRKEMQGSQSSEEAGVKELLTSFLNAYVHDQQAIRERFDELSQSRQSLKDARSSSDDVGNRTNRLDSNKGFHSDTSEKQRVNPIATKSTRPSSASSSRDSSPTSKVSPKLSADPIPLKSIKPQQGDDGKARPLSRDPSPVAIPPSLKVSKLASKDKDISRNISGSLGSDQSNVNMRRSDSPKSRKSLSKPTFAGVTIVPRDELSYLPQYHGKKPDQDYNAIPIDLETSLGLKSNPYSPYGSPTSPINNEGYAVDQYEDDGASVADSISSDPKRGRLLSPFFSKIPLSKRRLSESSPSSSRAETPTRLSIESTGTGSNPASRSTSRHKGRLEPKPSPFKDPLSRTKLKPRTDKPQKEVPSKKKAVSVDKVSRSPTGSDVTSLTSTTTTTTLTPSGMVPAGHPYPHNSFDHHLLGAAVKVKPNAPTRDATFTQG